MPKETNVSTPKFPVRLKALRERKGLPAYILSDLCGVSHSMVGCYERGDCRPTIEVLFRLCDALDCSADYLIGRTEEMGVTGHG